MEFVKKNRALIVSYMMVLIALFSCALLGIFERIGYESRVLDYFLIITGLFAFVTLYYEQDRKLDLNEESMRRFVFYDLIYTGIGLVVGIFFLIIYIILK